MRALLLVLLATPALAQEGDVEAGDAAAGEAAFARQCVSCHVVEDPGGEVLAGRTARTGPNLYGVAGRVPGSVEGYRYSDAMLAYGATGAVWAEDNFVPYVQDPTGFLRDALEDRRARGKMAYQVRDEEEARDLWAYLATFRGPATEPAGEATE